MLLDKNTFKRPDPDPAPCIHPSFNVWFYDERTLEVVGWWFEPGRLITCPLCAGIMIIAQCVHCTLWTQYNTANNTVHSAQCMCGHHDHCGSSAPIIAKITRGSFDRGWWPPSPPEIILSKDNAHRVCLLNSKNSRSSSVLHTWLLSGIYPPELVGSTFAHLRGLQACFHRGLRPVNQQLLQPPASFSYWLRRCGRLHCSDPHQKQPVAIIEGVVDWTAPVSSNNSLLNLSPAAHYRRLLTDGRWTRMRIGYRWNPLQLIWERLPFQPVIAAAAHKAPNRLPPVLSNLMHVRKGTLLTG